MPDDLRLSPQTLAVLSELLATGAEWRYGYDLSKATGLKSGTLYPILIRLAERDWVEAAWQHARENGKPRHMYRLSAAGRRAARVAVETRSKPLRALRPAMGKR